MDIKVSVIIPIYNVELYLKRCVNSVINQTLKELEIILVDDGSFDNCPHLCDELAKNDNRIIVIHKKNGGLSSARNAGLKIAKGKYIFFCDSDDWLELDGIEKLYLKAEEYDVDFVRYRSIRSGWPGLKEHSPCYVENIREIGGGFYDKGRIYNEIYPKMICTNQLTMGAIVGVCSSLYKSSFLNDNLLYFDEKVKFSEDMIFSAKVVYNCNNFYYINEPCVYNYYFNPNSISKSFREERWDSCKELIVLFDKTFSHCKEYDFTQQLLNLKWFCLLLALDERKYINNIYDKIIYCHKILDDKDIDLKSLSLKNLEISWKLKLILFLIKFKIYNLIARL